MGLNCYVNIHDVVSCHARIPSTRAKVIIPGSNADDEQVESLHNSFLLVTSYIIHKQLSSLASCYCLGYYLAFRWSFPESVQLSWVWLLDLTWTGSDPDLRLHNFMHNSCLWKASPGFCHTTTTTATVLVGNERKDGILSFAKIHSIRYIFIHDGLIRVQFCTVRLSLLGSLAITCFLEFGALKSLQVRDAIRDYIHTYLYLDG